MSSSLRIALVVAISLLAAFLLGKYYGDTLVWIIIFTAFGIASDSALRAMHAARKLNKRQKKLTKLKVTDQPDLLKPQKPPKPRF